MMKKLVAMLLIFSMLLSLVACNKTMQVEPPTGGSNQQNNDSSGKDENNIQPNTKNIDIVRGSMFNEGIALVLLRDRGYLTAIDIEGNEIFSLDEGYHLDPYAYDKETIYYGGNVCYGFTNGLIYIENKQMKDLLCDKNGTLYKPEDFGGTDFEGGRNINLMLTDNLILVANENDQMMGVLNASFEWIIPLSQAFYQEYHSYDDLKNLKYYNGYLFSTERENQQYLNLRTGAAGTALGEIETERPSDLWYLNQDADVIDVRTLEAVMHIDGVNNRLFNTDFGQYFHNGMKLALYLKNTEQGCQMAYYVVNDSGEFLVTPTNKESKFINEYVAATDSSVMFATDDKLLLSYATEQLYESSRGSKTILADTKWEVRDFNGNVLGSFEVPTPESSEEYKKWVSNVEAYVFGGVIMVSYSYTTYSVKYEYQTDEKYTQYFTLNFEPLF